MKVAVYPGGYDGCGWYRLRFPAEALIAQGADVEVNDSIPDILWMGWPDRHRSLPDPNSTAYGFVKRPAADVVVIQRPGRRWYADLIPFWHEYGIRVVVDIDDRFDCIPAKNRAKGQWTGLQPDFGLEHLDRACREADLVTCSTHAIRDRFGFGHGLVLPNLVPEHYLEVSPRKLPNTLGWTGTLSTHDGDVQVTRGAVGQAMRSAGWRFHHIGPGDRVKEAFELDGVQVGSTGWVDLIADYPSAYAQLEVAVVPLESNEFNAGKSSLKMSEAAALGVPVVASPTPDNCRLHKMGVGILADTPAQWHRRVTALMKNPEYRAEVSASSRDVMRARTYESQADRWWTAWTERTN